jgi:hypothetical protein
MSQSLLNTAHNPYEYSLFIKKQSIIKLIKILRNKQNFIKNIFNSKY